MKLNWNFPGSRGGAKQKTFHGGSTHGYFLELLIAHERDTGLA